MEASTFYPSYLGKSPGPCSCPGPTSVSTPVPPVRAVPMWVTCRNLAQGFMDPMATSPPSQNSFLQKLHVRLSAWGEEASVAAIAAVESEK